MSKVAVPDRLDSARVVYGGVHGEISRQAEKRGVSRQRLYREADSVLRDLDGTQHQQRIDSLTQQINQLQTRVDELQSRHPLTVVLDASLQKELACCAQAEGVSLPVTRRLLAVLLKDHAPSVATLGRVTRQAALAAGPLLEVLDEQTRPLVRQAAADELFFGQQPALMVVEPQSHCWVSGRISPSREGQEWQKELQVLPNLEHLARDGGTGLEKGVDLVNQQRREEATKRQADPKPISEQLDHFHTLRDGRRALRKCQARAERAWAAAEEADKKVARQHRHGKAKTGYKTQAVLKWKQAEEAFQEWDKAGETLEAISVALRPFTPEGEMNSRQRAEGTVKTLAASLQGEQWGKFKRALGRPQTYAYLDRQEALVKELPVAQEVREAVLKSEAIRQNPELLRGEGAKQGAWRGLVVIYAVMIATAGEAGKRAVLAMRQMNQTAARSSSCVEGLNSVIRMQQSRHRKMTQELLDLKRLYWNLRQFRTGRRKGACPYRLLGLRLPPDLTWSQVLKLSPDQLRLVLSAATPPP